VLLGIARHNELSRSAKAPTVQPLDATPHTDRAFPVLIFGGKNERQKLHWFGSLTAVILHGCTIAEWRSGRRLARSS